MAITSSSVFAEYPKPVLIGVSLFLTILPTVIVALRFYARHRTRAGIGSDDWVILFALVLCIGGGIVVILAAEMGRLGQHQQLDPHGELIHSSTLTNYEKTLYASLIITTLNLGVVKISILLFYRKLFTVKPFMIASGLMMGFVAAWTISFVSAVAAQCVPAREFWELFEAEYMAHCMDVQSMYQALAYSDLIVDVMVLALPIPMVVTLHLPWRKKIKVLDVFLLGFVVLGSGIARVVSFVQAVSITNQDPAAFFKDTSWYVAGSFFWTFAENSIAIIGACLPSLAALRTMKRSSSPQANSYYVKRKRGQNLSNYNHLEDPFQRRSFQRAGTAEDASVRHLVSLGHTTNIHADEIPLEDRPQPREGIIVNTTLSTDAN